MVCFRVKFPWITMIFWEQFYDIFGCDGHGKSRTCCTYFEVFKSQQSYSIVWKLILFHVKTCTTYLLWSCRFDAKSAIKNFPFYLQIFCKFKEQKLSDVISLLSWIVLNVFVTKFYTMRKILNIISCDKMIIKWQMHSFPCIQQVLHYIYLA